MNLCCPKCGNDEVSEADAVLVTYHGAWVRDDEGDVAFSANGDSDVAWDSAQADEEEPAFCRQCDWSGKPEDLTGPRCGGGGELTELLTRDEFGNWDTKEWPCPGCADCKPAGVVV